MAQARKRYRRADGREWGLIEDADCEGPRKVIHGMAKSALNECIEIKRICCANTIN
jgi:hypothetical protein